MRKKVNLLIISRAFLWMAGPGNLLTVLLSVIFIFPLFLAVARSIHGINWWIFVSIMAAYVFKMVAVGQDWLLCSQDSPCTSSALYGYQLLQWPPECICPWRWWIGPPYLANNLWQGAESLGMVHLECLVLHRWECSSCSTRSGQYFKYWAQHPSRNWGNITPEPVFLLYPWIDCEPCAALVILAHCSCVPDLRNGVC